MKKITALAIVVLVATASVPFTGFNLFIMGGQSNAVGVAPVPNQNTFEEIQAIGANYRWYTAVEPVYQLGTEYCVDSVNCSPQAGFGPSKRFGIVLRFHDPDMLVGLIPIAKGGTSITAWQRDYSDETLYGAMLKRTRAALTRGTIRGLVFIQGEGDTRNYDVASQWDVYFEQMVADLRDDLDMPDLPVVFAGLANNTCTGYDYWDLLRSRQEAVDISNAVYVDMSDIDLTINCVHYNVPGYNTLAQRLADAWWNNFGE